MNRLASALAAAIVVAPMAAGAATLAPGSLSGTGVAATFTSGGDRVVVPFTVASGFEAVLGVSISGDATGEYGAFADSLLAVEFGLAADASADVSQQFSTATDFTLPASASFEFGAYDLNEGETAYLIFEMPSEFQFGADGELLLSYAYSSELRPVSPTNPIPLPASALLFMSGLGGLAVFGRKKRS